MSKSTAFSLFTLLLTVPSQVLADESDNAEPVASCVDSQGNTGDKAIIINADKTSLIENDKAQFDGNVSLCHKDTRLKADSATFSKSNNKVEAQGKINYATDSVSVTSKTFEADFNNNTVVLDKADYTLAENIAHGDASQLAIDGDKNLTLKDATFTTCPIGDDSWLLSAQEITLSEEEGWGEAWNAVIKIKDTPVLYIPWLTFAVDDRRKTGFLYPQIKSSVKYGLELETPYYINLAENYDLTLTPRYMSKRGMQFKSEFRYLTDMHQGQLNVEFLNDDDDAKELGSRHLFHLRNKSYLSDNVRAYVDYSDVSDDAYLADLRPGGSSPSDTQLYKHAELAWFGDDVTATVRLQDFEILGEHNEAYQTIPQVELYNSEAIKLGMFQVNWLGEYSHFKNNFANIYEADRFHIEPSISLPYESAAISAEAKVSLMQTWYDQKLRESEGAIDPSVSRTIPKFKFNTKVHFERETDWQGKQAVHTFEPQIQYLYIPYRDQSEIGNFDSTRLQDDYWGLFRENRFSGLDRISDANQLTIGATTRLFNDKNEEMFHFSFGQVFYFSRKDARDLNIQNENLSVSSSRSALAGDLMFHWHERWYFYGEVQYDTQSDRLTQSNLSLDYRGKNDTLAQLNHRYSRDVSGIDIEQLGLNTTFPLTKEWQFVGGYYRDLTLDRSIESYVGLQYESCCWALRLVYNRRIDTNLEQFRILTNQDVQFDSGISLQFVIKGIGSKRGFNTKDMLRDGIFGYRRPYFINN